MRKRTLYKVCKDSKISYSIRRTPVCPRWDECCYPPQLPPDIRGDERGHSLSPPILPLTLSFNFFLCPSLCLSNSPVPGTFLSLSFSLSVSFFQPQTAQHCGTQDPLQGQDLYSVVCGKAKSSLHISCLSCLKLAAGCPYLHRPGFLWDGEEREECTEGRRIKVYVKSISSPVIFPLSFGQNSSFYSALFSFLFQPLGMSNDICTLCHH